MSGKVPVAEANAADQAKLDIEQAEQLRTACKAVRNQVAKAVVGQEEVIDQLLIAMLARGHCLLEGVPGAGKNADDPLVGGIDELDVSSDPIHTRFDAG